MLLDGEDVTDDPMYARARKGIGYLPQEPSIFRGLTVEQNILAILETLGLDAQTRRARCEELLAELHLTPLAKAPATRCRAASGAVQRSRARSSCRRASSCWMSRLPASIRSRSATSRTSFST